MFESIKQVVIPTRQEVQEYATSCLNDEDEHRRRTRDPNQLLKNVWVYIEVLDLPREVKACSLMEIAISLITIITLKEIEKLRIRKGKG
jgi:hypothetical protein